MTFIPGNNHGSFLACWCSLLLVSVCTLCRDSIQAGWDTLPLVMIISWLVADSESYQMRLLLTSVPAEVCLLSVGLCTIFSLASEFFNAPVWLIVLQDRDVQLAVFLRVNSNSREWELTLSWLRVDSFEPTHWVNTRELTLTCFQVEWQKYWQKAHKKCFYF